MIEDLGYYIFLLIGIILCYIVYIKLNVKYFKIRACIILLYLVFTSIFLNIIFKVNNNVCIIVQYLFFLFCLFCKCFSYIKSDKINDGNVCIIFYKPKKIKQFLFSIFGLSYSSAGLVINRHIYQMRYEAETLQEIPFKEGTEEYLREKYLIVDTGFKYKDLKGNWKENLLSQSARQKATWNLRFNCLRSLRFVLNQIPGYKYHDEIFPCLYLFRMKVARLVKGRKNKE